MDPTSLELDAQAARWVARVDRGPLDAGEAAELEQWLARGSRFQGAYARAQAAFVYMNPEVAAAVRAVEAPLAWASHEPPAEESLSRRRLMWLGGGAAAAAAAGVAALTSRGEAPISTYNARRGQIRLVSLPDGSLITLDTSSSVAVQFEERSRNVTLLSGRALFNVAKDPARPFIVSAGGLVVRAVGTAFAVRKPDSRPPEVLVQEGIVDVGANAGKAPVRVGANMRVALDAAGGMRMVALDPAAVSRELSWRQGMLAFEDVSLMSAAEEFARYSDMEIVIRDPAVGNVTITGVFSVNNPLGFARAAALSLGLKLEVKDGKIRLDRS